MNPLDSITKQYNEKRTALTPLVSPVDAGGNPRDLTADESTRFKALSGECLELKSRIDNLTALGYATPAESEPEPVGRGRRSDDFGANVNRGVSKRPWSLLRCVDRLASGYALDGVEGEVQKILGQRSGKGTRGFFVPLSNDEEIREAMNAPERRDVPAGTMGLTAGAGSIFVSPTGEIPFIDMLRARLVLKRAGAQFLSGMHGNFKVPSQTGTNSVSWVGEAQSANPTNATTGMVEFTPKIAIALTNIDPQFIAQTSLDPEMFVRNDFAKVIGREIDRVGLNGGPAGSTTQPVGILQDANIAAASAGLALNGAKPKWSDLIAMETQVASANADADGATLAYICTPGLRGALKQTPKTSAGYPSFLWEDGANRGEGEVNGYLGLTTTNMPANLTKSGVTGSGSLHSLIYGDFSQVVVSCFDSMEVLLNPFSGQASGTLAISLKATVDVEYLREVAFAVITDAGLS